MRLGLAFLNKMLTTTLKKEIGKAGRVDGILPNGGNRVIEQIEGNKVIFSLRQPAEDWEEWAKTLGRLVRTGKDQGFIERGDVSYPYQIRRFNNSIVIEVDGPGHADRYVFSAFRAVALRVLIVRTVRAVK